MQKTSAWIAGLLLASFATAQQISIPNPTFGTTFTSSLTRGFWFTCPVDCVLVRLLVPNEGAQPYQVVEVIDFGATPPPTWPATATGTQLFYDNQGAGGSYTYANVSLHAGRHYGILGACTPATTSATSYNSYGSNSGDYDTTVFGIPVTLHRFGTQSGIASNGGNQPCWSDVGALGRVTVQITQERIMLPGFSYTYASTQTRGFYFMAPVTCRINSLQVPNEAGQPYQVVEVIDFGTTPPPAYPATVTGTQLFYSNTSSGGATIGTNILLQVGHVYGILGACTATSTNTTSYNSYAPPGGYLGNAFGVYPILAKRLLTQSGIASNGGNQPCSAEDNGNIARVFVGLDGAGTYNSGSLNDYYISTNGWPSTGAPAPSPLVGIRVGNPAFTVRGPTTAAGGLVIGLTNFGIMAAPGTTCLPPLGGSFASLPSVAACGGTTNMSMDLAQNPMGSWILFYGVLDANGDNTVTMPITGFIGIAGSTQAFFFDYSVGFVATEAFNWLICP